MVRYFAEKIRQLAGRPVIVENRPGANGNTPSNTRRVRSPTAATILGDAGSGGGIANQALFKKPPSDAKLLRVAA